MKTILCIFGASFLALGGWAAFDAESFTRILADFGPYNAHLIHDIASALVTFGVGLVVAAFVESWRTPMLALVAIWNGLHGISHIVDLGDAASRSLGIGEIAISVVAAALLAAMAVRSAR